MTSTAPLPAAVWASVILLAACSQAPVTPPEPPKPQSIPASLLLKKPGGFYTDERPDRPAPVDLDRLADPEPRAEPLNSAANLPYTAFGRDYVPLAAPGNYRRQGTASWYGRKFHGQRTASGEHYDMFSLTAAHPTLPIPSYARVRNLANQRSVIVRINDRGPFSSGRIIDVSYAAAHKLGFVEDALAHVEVQSLLPDGAAVAAAVVPLEAPRPEPLPAVPVAAEPSGVYLQLGAFANPANAENFSARVKRELDWLQEPLTVFGVKGLYRLQLGPFRNRTEAGQAAQRIREALEVRPMVVVR
jgi:rare lipoprotein A